MFIDANRVKALRLERQWSQDELAIATGLSRRTIQRVESDSCGSLQTLKSLASVFSIDAIELQQLETGRASITFDHNVERSDGVAYVKSTERDGDSYRKFLFESDTWFSKRVAVVAAFAFVLVTVVAFGAIFPDLTNNIDPGLAPGKHQLFFKTDDGLERSYFLHVPQGYEDKALPLVIVLIGPRGSMDTFQEELGFEPLADREGFLVAYPEAIGSRPKGWNTNPADYHAPCCGEAGDKNIDDVNFVVNLKYDLANQTKVDLNRVFVFGKGPGGHFAHRIMCEASAEFHAFAYVNGYLDESWADCTPSQPRPIKGYHGRHSPWVDIDGCSETRPCEFGNFQARFESMTKLKILSGAYRPLGFQKTYDIYAKRHQCAATSTELIRAGESFCQARNNCPANAEVEMCIIDGGHFINTHTDIHVTQDIWEFFSRY